MALGGVATGNMKANEADSVAGNIRTKGLSLCSQPEKSICLQPLCGEVWATKLIIRVQKLILIFKLI